MSSKVREVKFNIGGRITQVLTTRLPLSKMSNFCQRILSLIPIIDRKRRFVSYEEEAFYSRIANLFCSLK